MSLAQTKIPAIVVSSIIFLALGAAAGVGVMTLFGYRLDYPTVPLSDRGKQKQLAFDKMMAEDRGKGGAGGTQRGLDSIGTLASLVTKLDQLSQRPLKVELDKKQQKEVAEQLHGLAELKELTEADAKKRLDSLLKVLESHKETLEMAGFRWPGQDGGLRPANTDSNPFQDEEHRKHLQALQAALSKG